MLAKDIMTTQVVTATPDTSIRHAVEIMLERGVSGLPVVDDTGTLVGIITEGDLLERGELGATLYLPSSGELKSADALARAFIKGHSWKVGDVMARGVVSVGENTSLGRVAALMIEHHTKRVPFVRDGRLVGIVSRSDLLRAILSVDEDSTASGDIAIRRSILTRLDEIGAGTGTKLVVVVSDGIVRLEGSVRSADEREAARVVAEGVHGVAGVVDHLQVEPTVENRSTNRK
ncbi:MAG: CBS domain-containing protein [Rhizobiaceae bacterium]